MPVYKCKVVLVDFERDKYLTDLKAACRQAMIEAAKSFLLAAAVRIPVFTGFARGSLAPLEEIAGPAPFPAPRSTKPYFYRGVRRSPATGRQFATPVSKIIPSGRLMQATGRAFLYFNFEVDIEYFTRLDTKWGAFTSGEAAFAAEARRQFANLAPDIRKYMVERA